MTLQERKYLVEECQKVAAAQSIRFSFLSGDVHVCAAGRLYSDPKVASRSAVFACRCAWNSTYSRLHGTQHIPDCMELNMFSIACMLACTRCTEFQCSVGSVSLFYALPYMLTLSLDSEQSCYASCISFAYLSICKYVTRSIYT